jgi:hypothetical protein
MFKINTPSKIFNMMVDVLNKSADTVVAVFVDKHTKANDRVVVATRRQ